MSGDLEDNDHTFFLALERLGSKASVLSRAAFQMNAFAAVQAYEDGHPRLVSDDYLGSISAETSGTALELCTAGFWARIEGGYRILDEETIEMVSEAHREMSSGQDPPADPQVR